jgi:hypothetical protein
MMKYSDETVVDVVLDFVVLDLIVVHVEIVAVVVHFSELID